MRRWENVHLYYILDRTIFIFIFEHFFDLRKNVFIYKRLYISLSQIHTFIYISGIQRPSEGLFTQLIWILED